MLGSMYWIGLTGWITCGREGLGHIDRHYASANAHHICTASHSRKCHPRGDRENINNHMEFEQSPSLSAL